MEIETPVLYLVQPAGPIEGLDMLDKRIETRMLCADLVDLQWKDKNGRTRRAIANLEDISVSGACLQVERPVPLTTAVKMAFPSGDLTGTVKYCVFREIGYFLGIEFTEGSRWTEQSFKPQHMLDPRRILPKNVKPPVRTTH